ncbi:MAG: hydantoinase/oxoprolinase family protein [Proteobacteria bacterium]|nr:hydantoinase/oxoprolinase family protein [Pseudomonadota bacterium]
MRIVVDTGGTFTDLLLEDDAGNLHLHKTPSSPGDPARAVLDAVAVAASALGISSNALLSRVAVFVYGTTIATNAVLENTTARTALLATRGHPDILMLREAGRMGLGRFDWTIPYPEPLVPRSLTFEVPERIDHAGRIITPLDEAAVSDLLATLPEQNVEAVAVCLLWSTVNPEHELAVGRLLDRCLPNLPYTLSHRINPSLREYRRASSAALDASLKPLMSAYLTDLETRLRESGLAGRLLVVTSKGALLDATAVAGAPIHALRSGPAMAPAAGRHYARSETGNGTAIVIDVGGTTCDVSLVSGDRMSWTRESWVGQPYLGHMTGFPSLDIRSIGSGGGSLARVDSGGLLHVGPHSAGAVPGPACYGLGGEGATVTDAALMLGYLDTQTPFAHGRPLDREAALEAIRRHVAAPLGIETVEAAAAIIAVLSEDMVSVIDRSAVAEGIDPAAATLVAGGGAAGFNAVAVARRLGSPRTIFPDTGAALSAAGGHIAELSAEHSDIYVTRCSDFDFHGVNATLGALIARCDAFAADAGSGAQEVLVTLAAEARYTGQIWEIEIPLRQCAFRSGEDVATLRADFDARHEVLFAHSDPESDVEIIAWHVRVSCRLRDSPIGRVVEENAGEHCSRRRTVFFRGSGWHDIPVIKLSDLRPNQRIAGPAIVEAPFTTIVVDPGMQGERSAAGSLIVLPALSD